MIRYQSSAASSAIKQRAYINFDGLFNKKRTSAQTNVEHSSPFIVRHVYEEELSVPNKVPEHVPTGLIQDRASTAKAMPVSEESL